jgi:hypothetical protein
LGASFVVGLPERIQNLAEQAQQSNCAKFRGKMGVDKQFEEGLTAEQ